MVLKEGAGVLGHEPLLLREANRLARLVGVSHTGLTVGCVGARDGVDTLTDDGLAHDHLRLTVRARLGLLKSLQDSVKGDRTWGKGK